MNYKDKIENAIEKLKKFASNHSNIMVILEDQPTDKTPEDILSVIMEYPSHCIDVHTGSFSKWHIENGVKQLSEEEWKKYNYSEDYEYFLKRYGSLTWLINENGIGYIYGYSSANTSGSGQFLINVPLPEDCELMAEDEEDDFEDDDDFDEVEEDNDFDEEILWKSQNISFSQWLEDTIEENIQDIKKQL